MWEGRTLSIALRYISLPAMALCVLNSECVRIPEQLTVSAEDDRLGGGAGTAASRRYDATSHNQGASRAIPAVEPTPAILSVGAILEDWSAEQTVRGGIGRDDPRSHPSQHGDPRCESRRSGPRLERDELRCDNRVQPRRVDNHAPPTTPSSQASSSMGQMPATGSVDGQQSRPAERDVGFDDTFTTQGNAQQARGAVAANPGGAAGSDGAAADTRRGRR
jgi:hypothetical protein